MVQELRVAVWRPVERKRQSDDKHNHSKDEHGDKDEPLELMSKAASLNMASVKASGCAESKASPICLIISRPRSDCPRTACAKWIIPDTCRHRGAKT